MLPWGGNGWVCLQSLPTQPPGQRGYHSSGKGPSLLHFSKTALRIKTIWMQMLGFAEGPRAHTSPGAPVPRVTPGFTKHTPCVSRVIPCLLTNTAPASFIRARDDFPPAKRISHLIPTWWHWGYSRNQTNTRTPFPIVSTQSPHISGKYTDPDNGRVYFPFENPSTFLLLCLSSPPLV